MQMSNASNFKKFSCFLFTQIGMCCFLIGLLELLHYNPLWYITSHVILIKPFACICLITAGFFLIILDLVFLSLIRNTFWMTQFGIKMVKQDERRLAHRTEILSYWVLQFIISALIFNIIGVVFVIIEIVFLVFRRISFFELVCKFRMCKVKA